MEDVNSAIKERCRVCRGERSDKLAKAPQRGLWSVRTENLRPSRTWRKCLIAKKTARSSLSNVLYFFSAALNFFEKKEMGRWSA